MPEKIILSYILASAIPLAVTGVLLQRLIEGRGIGVRAIQFVAATSISPIIAILALSNIIDGHTVSALFGALIGYLFANIGDFDNKDKCKYKTKTEAEAQNSAD